MGYQTLAFDTTNISKLFMIQMRSVFGLQRPQLTDIGGQNGGRIESSCKYIVWGIKLLLLIPQTYLSYLWSKALCVWPTTTSMEEYWRSKCRSNWKFFKVYHVGYQTLAFESTNLSKLFMIQVHSVFILNGGQIESFVSWPPKTSIKGYWRSKWRWNWKFL